MSWTPLYASFDIYVMGQRSFFFNSVSAGMIFRRQILTSKDGPRAERVNFFITQQDYDAQVKSVIVNERVYKHQNLLMLCHTLNK